MSEDRFTGFDEELRSQLDQWVTNLGDYCRIPSLAADPAALEEAAEWTSRCLADAGATVTVVRRPGAPPLVTGEFGTGPETVICLHHYDVQPVEPLAAWTSPPFDPSERDGRLYGRGTLDNKGSFLLRLQSVSAYLAAIGDLPVRVRFLVEGEEESGSPNLAALIAQRPEIVAGSAVLNEGGYHDATGRPLLTCGIRGLLYVELRVREIAQDVHSELAMLLPNAGWRLVHALASLTTPAQQANVTALGDCVRAPTAAQVEHVRRDSFDETGLKQLFGIDEFVGGLTGDAAAEAAMFVSTLNLSGVSAGWTGPGVKTVIPAVASAKLDLRLVPDQTPAAALAALRDHLDAHGFSDVEIDPIAEFMPWWTPVDAPLVEAAAGAVRLVYGCDPARLVSSMSSAPLYQVCSPHSLPSVGFGCAHPDSGAHAPDEHIRIDEMLRSAQVFGRFLEVFSAGLRDAGGGDRGG